MTNKNIILRSFRKNTLDSVSAISVKRRYQVLFYHVSSPQYFSLRILRLKYKPKKYPSILKLSTEWKKLTLLLVFL